MKELKLEEIVIVLRRMEVYLMLDRIVRSLAECAKTKKRVRILLYFQFLLILASMEKRFFHLVL